MILPQVRIAPLRGGPVLRWGVVAPGNIAAAWVKSVQQNTDQIVAAVASRALGRAEEFAGRFAIPAAHGEYQQLFDSPHIDVVYIAAPHSEHRDLALRAIAAGKHVLIEKPIAVNAAEAAQIAGAARAAGVFALEAMWSRFLPQAALVRALVDSGELGEVRHVTGDFGGAMSTDPLGRAYNPKLAGGALLDMGVYPAWFAHFLLGEPSAVTASGTLASTGVDDQVAFILNYDSGAQAVGTVSMLVETPRLATVSGQAGRIEFAGTFFGPTSLTITLRGETDRWTDGTGFVLGDGLCYQVTAAAHHIAAGLLEAPEHTLNDSIAVLRVLDEARRQISDRRGY